MASPGTKFRKHKRPGKRFSGLLRAAFQKPTDDFKTMVIDGGMGVQSYRVLRMVKK